MASRDPRRADDVLPPDGLGGPSAWGEPSADAAALAESEQRFSLAMEHSAVAMNITGPDGRFLRVNDAMARLLGMDRQALLRSTWRDVTHADDLAADEALARDLMDGRRDHYRLAKRYLRSDGSVVWGDLTVSCVRGPDGTMEYALAQIVDVSEQHRALATLDATVASMLDPHAFLVPVRDERGVVVDLVYERVNAAACDYLGRGPDELLGQRVRLLFSGPAVDQLIGWCAEALATADGVSRDDVALASAVTGDDRWFDIRAVRVLEGVSFTWRDVSSRHRAADELARREYQFRLLADHATDVIVRSASGGRVEWVSPSVTEVLGWRIDEVVGRSLADLMHPDDLARVRGAQRAILEAGGTEGRTTARFATAGGGWRWMSDHGRAMTDDHGRIVGGIDSLRDIQAEQEARLALEAREAELRAVVDSLLDPWVLLEALRDEGGRIVDLVYVDANEAACEFNHVSRADLIGRRLLELLPQHGADGFLERYAAVVETGHPLVEDDMPFTGPVDGIERRFDNRAVRVGDGISLMWRDVSERFEARQALREQADHDLLTGAANRRLLERRMAEVLGRQPRTGRSIAVLYCDLDHFKDVNDTHGHAVGDEVLASVAEALRGAVREGDIVARLGGDEFVLVLDGVRDAADARAVAEKVRSAVARPLTVGSLTLRPRVSIGIALGSPGDDPTGLLARADRALYAAKDGGRDRAVLQESPRD